MRADMENKPKLLIIAGPTAVGKTGLSIELAKRLNGEVVSADSMQVYRGMDIGTAKITESEKEGIPHHLIDILEPDGEFSVLIFKELAKKVIDGIISRGHLPIVVGGTGYYIQALLYDVDFTEYDDEAQGKIRAKLEDMLLNNGSLYMHEYLRRIDPESAKIIHMNNTKRMLHAIEYYELTGRKISEHNEEQRKRSSPYDFIYLVLNDERDKVYERIDSRVDMMIKDGLVEEVKRLVDAGYGRELPSMLGLGYKEIADYLAGECSLEEAIYLIKRDTRHFAKKQLTWFHREKETLFVDRSEFPGKDELVGYCDKLVREKLRL